MMTGIGNARSPIWAADGGDMMRIDILVALFVGMMLGANFAVIILAFLEANHVDSDM